MNSKKVFFELIKTHKEARLGQIRTSRGLIDTPAFMPVGTQGTVKGSFTDDILKTSTQIILGNTYHLFLRHGIETLKKFHGFIALGCVIKGQTPHFDFISKSTTDALMTLSITSKKPVGNGVITCLSKKQAVERGKKGSEAAEAVLSVLFQ